MLRVVHFELPADDPERAVRFYREVFNWKIEKWGGPVDYWLVTTGKDKEAGINGAIGRREQMIGYVNTIDVPSVDEFTDKVTASGGEVVMPKWPVPGVGYVAYCKDPEGNIFGIMQEDPSAR